MRKNHFVDVIYTHTEGEPTCIVYGGIPYPFGLDILAKRNFLEENYDWLRKALMREPRGHRAMFGVFLTPPSSKDTDGGMLWMDGEHFMNMCGHGTIALTMAMVAHGLIKSNDPITKIRLETTAGLVTAEVESTKDGVHSSSFTNVPAYIHQKDMPVNLPGYGELKADIVFGGNYFGIIKWDKAKKEICPDNGKFFSEMGQIAKAQLREKLKLQHPEKKHITILDIVTFYHEGSRPDAFYKNVHVVGDGYLDRSPGGTGTSAMIAMLEGRGKIVIGQTIKSEGLLGSGTFEGTVLSETKLGERRAVIPRVKGTANIVGYAKWLIDPEDPVGKGFVIS